jgi:tetratricopeptide (TPR) repeat protein
MADSPPDLTKALDEIRREVIESRNMTIKTDNALRSLHAELKNVSGRQEAFARRTWVSTAAAYALFTGLCVAGVIAILGARTASASAERERLEKQVAELGATIASLKADAAAQLAAEQGAMQVYKMMTSLPGDERLKGIDALQKLDQTKLSAFARLALQERAASLRREVGAGILEKGKAAFRRQDWAEAAAQLSRFLAMEPPAEDALEASFFLGNALFQARKFEEAIKPLSRFVEGDKKARARDFAMVLLSQAYDMVGDREQGYAVAREALATYPGSDFRAQLQGRVAKGAGTASPQPAPAPGGPAPVTPPVATPTTAPSLAVPALPPSAAPGPAVPAPPPVKPSSTATVPAPPPPSTLPGPGTAAPAPPQTTPANPAAAPSAPR